MSRPHSSESVFRAIADRHRRRILALLHQRERTPGELSEAIRLSGPALTFHLRVLLKASLISQRRRGRHRMYRVHPGLLRPAIQFLSTFTPETKRSSS